MAEQGGRWGRQLRMVAAVAVLVALAGYLLLLGRSGDEGPFRCVVEGEGEKSAFEVEPQMIRNAATIEAVAAARDLPDRAVTIALATAMQESMLRNIDYGDRDSVGLFQQRPSQGWGTVEQIMDPVYSAGKFYERLVEIPNYAELPLTEAAQKVQLSAFPDEYAKHEPRAAQLTAALTGRAKAGLNCLGKRDGEPVVGEVSTVRAKLEREHGLRPAAEGGDDGATLAVPVSRDDAKPGTSDSSKAEVTRQGWRLAHWALANASHLGLERIAYGPYVWRADEASSGWQKIEDGPSPSEVRLTLAR